MSPPRQQRPLFRVFDRDPDRHRPVDGDFVQERPVRLHRPGPWRTALVVALAVLTTWSALAAAVAVAGARGLLVKAVVLVVVMIPVGVLIWITARVLAVGPYVTDRALRQTRVLSVSEVAGATSPTYAGCPGACRCSGSARRSTASAWWSCCATAASWPRRSRPRSPDFLGRAEAYDVAALAVERWWHESRGAAA